MTVSYYNRVKFLTATPGTSTITVDQEVPNFRTPAQAGVPDGAVVTYVIEESSAWETGEGVIGNSGTTMTRSVRQSSNNDELIVLTGSATVRIARLAEEENEPPPSGATPTYFVVNNSTQTITANGSWEILSGTNLAFTAEKTLYHIRATFTHAFTRDGWWEMAYIKIDGSNLGTITPVEWALEIIDGDHHGGSWRQTYSMSFVIQPTIGASVSLNLYVNNSNTGNYNTFDRIFMEAI